MECFRQTMTTTKTYHACTFSVQPLKTRITLRLLKHDDLLLQQKVNRRMALASAFDPEVSFLLQ